MTHFNSLLATVVVITFSVITQAAPMGSAFTYQGELQQNGNPANGLFDLEFQLFESEASGDPASTSIQISAVGINEGIFTVELDFGAQPFSGQQLWLQIGVREDGDPGGFTPLAPRQKLLLPPQAQPRIQGACGIGNVLTGFEEDGTVVCSVIPVGLIVTPDRSGNTNPGSIAVRLNDLPIVAFRDTLNNNLTVFDCANPACTAATSRTLDDSVNVGAFSDIAVRGNGNPIISYYDIGQADLRVFDCFDAGCSTGTHRTLDSGGLVGRSTSIAIRNSGLPIISYQDDSGDELRVFDCSDAACSSGTVRPLDATPTTGEIATTIAIRGNGLPIISYRMSQEIRLFDCDNDACSSGTVRVVDSSNGYPNLAIRPNGIPVVTYDQPQGFDLKFYDCVDMACTDGATRTLDSSRFVWSSSIVVRQSGLPIVAYQVSNDDDLRIFDCLDAGCTFGISRLLDPPARFTNALVDIALRAGDLPIISYWDSNYSHIKLFSCGDPKCEN